MRQAIDHFLYTNVNTFLVLCYHLLTYIQFNFNHHVIGIQKFIILRSLWSVTRIYANLSKQKKKFTLPGNQFSCIKRVNRPFQLVCYFVLPFHQTLLCFSRELFHLNVLLSSCARALYECIIYEIRLKTSRGLQWENQKLYFHQPC